MKPVIALVGRPNVGKSTLFNRLTHARDALVVDEPGITRDRQYGIGRTWKRSFIVVDTAGVSELDKINTISQTKTPSLTGIASKQTLQAIQEAHAILFMVDGRQGIHPYDQELAKLLRTVPQKVHVVVNKSEGLDPSVVGADFFQLGLGDPLSISAAHGDGVNSLIDFVLEEFPEDNEAEEAEEDGPRISVVGRPNVGKSTLVNAIVGEERVVVFDQPGTTRDSIEVPFQRSGKKYVLIDTAGVRRRKNVSEAIEKYSIIKTLQAIDESNVVLLVLDAGEGITDQDVTLAGHVLEAGRAIVVIVNKWDKTDPESKAQIKRDIERKMPFLHFARLHFISALKGTGIGGIYKSLDEAFAAAFVKLGTSVLNRTLRDAVEKTPPPMVQGRRIKLKFAHQGGKNPPTIIVHGNQVDQVPQSYQRYLMNVFRKVFHLQGTPLRVSFSQGKNPFEGTRRKKASSKAGKRPGKARKNIRKTR
ncbi:MAG: ribosome biogenesis GTPase Der [Gammaproteobacteria bacterium]|nr:ribosome biogenesis GTPase Der [Gammaproteobacteria bacterium]